MDAFGGEYVPADQLGERAQHGRAGADMIGQSRDVEVDAFAGVGFALPVQRLMLAELGIEDRRQQARPDMAARDDMERCRRLGDRLARPAGELLAHGLDHLPLPRHDLQRFGDGLAEFGELAAAARAGGWARDHHPLARQVRRERRACRPSAGEWMHHRAADRRGSDLVLGRAGGDFLKLQFQLVEQFAAALGGLPVLLAPQPGDQQLQLRHHRLGARGARFRLLARRAFGGQRRLQRGDLGGEVLGGSCHLPIVPERSSLVVAQPQGECQSAAALSGGLRSPGSHRVPPVNAVKHIGQLRRGDRDRAVGRRRPYKPAAL